MKNREPFKKTKNELTEKLRKAPYGDRLAVYDMDSGKIIEMWPKTLTSKSTLTAKAAGYLSVRLNL